MRAAKACLALIGAATLAACVAVGAGRIYHVRYPFYTSSYLAYAAGQGPISLRVFGEPKAGVGELPTANVVAEAMTGANFGVPVTYEPTTAMPGEGYFMVVRFGGGGPPKDLCQGVKSPGLGPEYAAAFCLNGDALSHLAGRIGDDDVNGVGFRRAMAYTANQLLPPENPDLGDCNRRRCD